MPDIVLAGGFAGLGILGFWGLGCCEVESCGGFDGLVGLPCFRGGSCPASIKITKKLGGGGGTPPEKVACCVLQSEVNNSVGGIRNSEASIS